MSLVFLGTWGLGYLSPASTVTGLVYSVTGSPVPATIRFQPQSTPYADSQTNLGGTISRQADSNGAFSLVLKQGRYKVHFPQANELIHILVPNDNNTYNLNDLSVDIPSTLGKISSRVLPGGGVTFETNAPGTFAEQVTITGGVQFTSSALAPSAAPAATNRAAIHYNTASGFSYNWSIGTQAWVPVPKVYRAILEQTGTNAPVATVLENTLGGTVVWTRKGRGRYPATPAGVFLNGKTWPAAAHHNLDAIGLSTANKLVISFGRTSDNACYLVIGMDGSGADFEDASIASMPVLIVVYP